MAFIAANQAQADVGFDRLPDIEHFFENATVQSGPTLEKCTLSRGRTNHLFFNHRQA